MRSSARLLFAAAATTAVLSCSPTPYMPAATTPPPVPRDAMRREPAARTGFDNPVLPNCADPGVLAVADPGGVATYFAACTGGELPIWTSRDLASWTRVPGAAILPDGKASWAAHGQWNWAPELHRVHDRFLAYYTSVNAAGVLSIGVAHAPSPAGPWTDRGAPLVEDPHGVIDANFFADDDGSLWLFYKIDGNAHGRPTPILVRRLAPDGLGFDPSSEATEVLSNDRDSWEGAVVEAPWVVKRDGRYYMFYAGNGFDHRYRTGVARAPSITGPWEKRGAPILINNDFWVGPGHGSVVRHGRAGGAVDYFMYHAWANAGDGTHLKEKGRMTLIDTITWRDGWPSIGDGTPDGTKSRRRLAQASQRRE